jgi:serine/threonine protein kinase
VAIKKAKVFADDDEAFFSELSQEASIMSSLRHPNVLQFLGTASNPPEIVILMEFMARGMSTKQCQSCEIF